MGDTLAGLSSDLGRTVWPLFAEELDSAYRARQHEAAERRPGPQELRPERTEIAGPTAPLGRIREVFDGLREVDKAVVVTAGRLLWLYHARDGEALSDYEAHLTVLAGCTTWDTWDHRGGGCHWNEDLWPYPGLPCPSEGCREGYIDDDPVWNLLGRIEAGEAVSDGESLGRCLDCGRELTVGEYRATAHGRNVLVEVPALRRRLL